MSSFTPSASDLGIGRKMLKVRPHSTSILVRLPKVFGLYRMYETSVAARRPTEERTGLSNLAADL